MSAVRDEARAAAPASSASSEPGAGPGPEPVAGPVAGPERTPSFVFVVTYGRSGSTLVTGLLNALPRTVVRGENGFYVLELFRAHQRAVEFAEAHANHRPRKVESAFYGLHLVTGGRLVDGERSLLLRLLLGDRPKRVARVGFKEVLWHRIPPEDTEAFFDWFDAVFPGARYVLNTRDIEQASTSGFWRSYDREEAVQAMQRVMEIQDFLRTTRPDRVLDTRYEVITGEDTAASDRALQELATFVLGRCNDRLLARMRAVLEVGYGPNPFGATRGKRKDAAGDG